LISPKQFIPIAEEMGFISSIGQWVFNKTCEIFTLWQKQNFKGFSMSVNVSVNELLLPDYIDTMIGIFEKYRIDPSNFQFEITESIFAQDPSMIISKLHQLKQIGFQLAMDDFGTGYSCLSYLKDLPIDVIKIDRSFVQSLSYSRNERHKAIIAAIVDLAKRLDMETLAEGVETKEQAEYLSSLGCEYLQGFLIAKPMPFEEATQFLTRHLRKKSDGNILYLKQ
jgi:EAL domain-containing protein (putative c-di-GMP-specific phosphodiesterase class I)